MKSELKIGMLSPIHWRTPPRFYGAWESVTSNLTEGLVKKGIKVTLFATGDSKTRAKLKWICPRPLMEDKTLEPRVYEFLHRALIFENASSFDIIHNHYDFYSLVFSPFVKTPILTTIHGFSSPLAASVYNRYNQTYYVSISQADRRHAPFLNYLATVYHGIDPEIYRFGKGGAYLIYLGRISWQKGVGQICQIAKEAGKKLILAGYLPPEEEEYFQKKVKPFLDGKQIKYLGMVSEKEKVKLLQNALAFIQWNAPQYKGEGFGLSLVEAQSCGTPVIARKHGPIPEVIKDGETGFIVKEKKEVKKALSKIPKIKREDCRVWILKNFTIKKMVENYIKVYQRILELEKK